MLKPARRLYVELVNTYGSSLASFIAAFEAPDKFNLESDVGVLINSVTTSIGHGIKDFSSSLDFDWLEKTIELLLPNLQVEISGKYIPIQKDWYELEMSTKCSTEIGILINCFKVQYSDFFSRWESLSSMIKEIQKNSKGLISLKDSIGKVGV